MAKKLTILSLVLPMLLALLYGCNKEVSPTCSIVSPEKGTSYDQVDSIGVIVEASDEDGHISQITLFVDSVEFSTTPGSSLETKIPAARLNEGEHSIIATVRDGEGLFGSARRQVDIRTINRPDVKITGIESVTDSSAKVTATIVGNGGSQVLERGICWSSGPSPDTDNYITFGADQETFTCSMGGLDHNATYYIRPFAHNKLGTGYGKEKTIQTEKKMGVPCEGTPMVTDQDGNTYQTVQIGDQCWMAGNLNVGKQIAGDQEQSDNQVIEKYCYNDNPANCDKYGGLYRWDEMVQHMSSEEAKQTGTIQGICPDGWHLPTEQDWLRLERYLGMSDPELLDEYWRGTVEGRMLKAGGQSGFDAQLAGQLDEHQAYNSMGYRGFYWTVTQSFSSTSWYRILGKKDPRINRFVTNKQEALSVRCVKNANV